MKQKMALFYSLLISIIGWAQNEDVRLNNLDKDIESLIAKYEAVGLSVAIIEDQSIIYSKGFGYRNRELKLEMNAETLLPIGSATKSFTATLLGLLENEQLVSLQEKPSKYIPKLEFFNEKMNDLITIEDLLSHKSGLGSQDGSNTFFPTLKNSDFIPRFKYLTPNGEVKNSFLYSNAGFGLSGLIIEEVTNSTWEQELQKRIFTPLEMHRSVANISSMEKDNNHGIGYGLSNGKQVKLLNRNFTFSRAEGALVTSVTEISNYLITWLNKGKFKDQQLIPEDYIFKASTLQNIRPQESMDEHYYLFGYGYGWFIQSVKGNYAFEHGGNVPGFSTQIALYPHKKIAIVVITNQNNSALPYVVEDVITNRMLELPKKPIEDYDVHISNVWNELRAINPLNSKKKPSHILEKYVGKYAHKGYGEIEIVLSNKMLHIKFPTFKFVLEHQEFDTFKMVNTSPIPEVFGLPFFDVIFKTNQNSEVNAVTFGFQQDPVVFQKH